LNEARFRQYVLAEYDAEPADRRRRDPQEALLRFYGRQDAAIDKSIRAAKQKVACRSGCSTCCHYKVEARAVEVLAIRDYVNAHFSSAQRATVLEVAQRNVAEAADWSHVEHLARNQCCPLLIDNMCSVYPVRPANCRSFHSTDVQVCIESHQRPEDLTIRVPYIEDVFEAATGTVAGFMQAARQAHLDATLYDLDSAFVEAMRDSTAADRLLSGTQVFRGAKVIGTPPD
jgi:Fe-S-cluster containining protein